MRLTQVSQSSIMADALGGGENERNAKLIALGITVRAPPRRHCSMC
jgi:hypothetical protein